MSSRALRSSAFLVASAAVAFAAQAAAGPTVGTGAPPVTTPGPTPTARPVMPRILGVRAAQAPYTSGRFGWEIQLDNPYPYRAPVTAIIADPPGSAVYDLEPNQRGWFPFSRANLADACTERQAWTMWLERTPDDKRVFEMTPNCTFKAAPPRMVAVSTMTAQVVAGRVSYATPTIKTTAPACGQPMVVEADVTNRTSGKITYLRLDLGPFQGSYFPLEAGETKRMAGGQTPYTGARGSFPFLLKHGSDSPSVVPGSFVTEITAECKPTFQMRLSVP